ncbi:MFS transporter [Paenirhodobacter sp.]|uniref:MFS transporter n=1 Tax=Paenirhodobacter sp. TaxID=1965326 RepID=UPI003B3E1FD5
MTAALWQNRNYRIVVSATAFAGFSNGVFAMALPWLATLMTRDPVAIGLVAASVKLPWLLFSLPAGVITDRVDRRLLVARADLLRAVLSLAIMAMALNFTGGGAIWLLCLIGMVFGVAEVLRENAALTLVPSIVQSRDLERANGTMWSVSQISGQFIGPPAAGLLIGLGVAVPFGLDTLTFALAGVLAWAMVLPPREAPARQRFLPALREGIGWLWREPGLFRLAAAVGVYNFFFMANTTVLVLYSQEVLGLSAGGHGLLLTAAATGGVLGAWYGVTVQRWLGLHRTMVLSLCVTALVYALIGATGSIWIAGPALAFEMFCRLVWSVVTVSWRQRQTPDVLLGRINSLYRFLAWGPMPPGALFGGWLVAVSGGWMERGAALHMPWLVGAAAITGLALYCQRALRLR